MVDERTELYPIGIKPPLGSVPKKMYAWTIREERFGEPIKSFQKEIIEVPELKSNEVLVLNVACGINYNGIWAGLGKPKNVIKSQKKYDGEHRDFFICGCESSGIVYAVGESVKDFKVGDEVVCIGTQFDKNCEVYKKYKDERISPTFRIWGYEGNWGAFAQFSKVLDVQCIKKPENISWEVAGACIATGGTVYDMYYHWKGNELKEGDVVLIWGGSGGLGINAITMAKMAGAIPVAVVSSDERGEFCMKHGAVGYLNRLNYKHWGELIEATVNDSRKYNAWLKEVTRFRNDFYKVIGQRKDPDIVIEHPGMDTLPTSVFMCAKNGMVVLCGASSGYTGTLDLRYLWMFLKRLQGAHATTRDDVVNYFALLASGKVNPCINHTYGFDDIPYIHQRLYENKFDKGNVAVRFIED